LVIIQIDRQKVSGIRLFFCNYSAMYKKPSRTSACNYSSVPQMFTSRLFSYTIGMLDGLIVGRWGAAE